MEQWWSQWYVVLLLTVWELVWKGVALWKAARNGHKNWYVAILVINTVGLLPIGYIIWDRYYRKEKKTGK